MVNCVAHHSLSFPHSINLGYPKPQWNAAAGLLMINQQQAVWAVVVLIDRHAMPLVDLGQLLE